MRRGAGDLSVGGMVDSATLLADPEWFAHRFVESDDSFRFTRLLRAAHGEVPFLADAYLGEREIGGDVPAEVCLKLPPDGPLHFLFHSAFCGSTMMVRALDRPGVAMGLSEPALFNDVVGFRRRGADPRAVARASDAAMRLLSRPFGAGEAVVAKPSNIINPLAPLLMALRPAAKAVFLFAPLETFLISVARKGLHCRLWVRELLEGYMREGVLEGLGFVSEDYFRLSDLQVAAVGWLAQHRLFAQLAEKLGPQRLASLDADAMLADPGRALTAIARHYGLVMDGTMIAAIANGPAFAQHSKSGATYSPEARAADYAKVRDAHGEEIGMVMVWAEAVANGAGVRLDAPNPLIPQA